MTISVVGAPEHPERDEAVFALRAALPEHLILDAESEDADILSVFTQNRVDSDTVKRLPKLKLIATRSTGYDHIDLSAMKAAGVTVCNVPSYGEDTVAEFTFALILALTRRLHSALNCFDPAGLRGNDLAGKTLGVIGAGRIGRRVAKIGKGFAMEVIAADPKPTESSLTYVPLDELLARSDIVCLCALLCQETFHLLEAKALASLKPGALVINTGRGGLIDTPALLVALDSGRLGGAALDVVEGEENLRQLGPQLTKSRPNLLLTPHIAYNTQEAVQRIHQMTATNIRAFASGNPQNSVI
jgi:D-lactate dehydrogenase